MTNPYHSMRLRLWNWGRYCRINPDRPDSSCANPLYEFMIDRADGYADEVATAATRVQEGASEVGEIELLDAMALDEIINRIDKDHRVLLVRKYVLRSLRPAPTAVDAAIKAIWEELGEG